MMRRGTWASDYLRIPFKDRGNTRDGADCWGFLRLILAEQCGIMVPEYEGVAAGDWRAKVREITRGASGGEGSTWATVAPGDEREFDGVLMRGQFRDGQGRAHSRPVHVGLVVRPGNLIHIEAGAGVTIVDYRRDMRVKRRVIAFYRWQGQR